MPIWILKVGKKETETDSEKIKDRIIKQALKKGKQVEILKDENTA